MADFTYAPDGETLREATWKQMLLGQVKETFTKQFKEKVDTFGNWTYRTKGIPDLFDAEYMSFEDVIGLIGSVSRKIAYRGADQGQNYGFTAKTSGGADIRLTCTEDDGVLCGDLNIDGNTYRTVGTRDENGELYFAALKPNGEIPWALLIPDGNGKREGTVFKGEEEIKVTFNPTRDGLMTYGFSTSVDDIVGIYQFEYPGDLRSGKLNVWRNVDNMEEFHFEIHNTGSNTHQFNMAEDEFTDYPGEMTTIYRYMWDDEGEKSYHYKIRFFDNFAVICEGSGDPNAFFAMGTSIEAIYAKLPAVG